MLNVGDVTLYFIEANGMKRTSMPDELREKLEKYF